MKSKKRASLLYHFVSTLIVVSFCTQQAFAVKSFHFTGPNDEC